MFDDEKHEYIAELEAWENLPLPVRIKTPKPTLTNGNEGVDV